MSLVLQGEWWLSFTISTNFKESQLADCQRTCKSNYTSICIGTNGKPISRKSRGHHLATINKILVFLLIKQQEKEKQKKNYPSYWPRQENGNQNSKNEDKVPYNRRQMEMKTKFNDNISVTVITLAEDITMPTSNPTQEPINKRKWSDLNSKCWIRAFKIKSSWFHSISSISHQFFSFSNFIQLILNFWFNF